MVMLRIISIGAPQPRCEQCDAAEKAMNYANSCRKEEESARMIKNGVIIVASLIMILCFAASDSAFFRAALIVVGAVAAFWVWASLAPKAKEALAKYRNSRTAVRPLILAGKYHVHECGRALLLDPAVLCIGIGPPEYEQVLQAKHCFVFVKSTGCSGSIQWRDSANKSLTLPAETMVTMIMAAGVTTRRHAQVTANPEWTIKAVLSRMAAHVIAHQPSHIEKETEAN